MIKLPDAKETKFVYHGGNGAFECGYESGWNAAITEVQRLNATAQPKCQKCGDTGMADSGGTQPWGEPTLIDCDCAAAQPVSDGWIKCSERLPDDNGRYLVLFIWMNSGPPVVNIADFQHTAYETPIMTWNYPREARITHWMPLPAAPGGQDD